MKFYFVFIVILVFLASCINNNSGNKSAEVSLTDSANKSIDTITKSNINSEPKPELSRAKLIIGKWQHAEDRSNIVEFTKKERKEIAKGQKEWDIEPYSLSDSCMEFKSLVNITNANYIYCKKSDLCWFIEKLDENNLILTYTSRGNTLRYKRIK